MNKEKEAYLRGFQDCLDNFENTIQMEIDRVSEKPDEITFIKAFDSVIATLYIAKLSISDKTRLKGETEELFCNSKADYKEFNIENLFKILSGEEDVYE